MADVLEDLKDLLHDASSSIQTIVDHGKDNQTQVADASEHNPKKSEAQDDRLVYSGKFIVKDININKVTAIAREICIKPVIAMGNSRGDSSMISYVVNDNPHRALGFFVLADDTERERGDVENAAKLRQLCEDEGWIAISTKDDWKTIYGPGVELDRDWVWDHPDATGPNARKVVSDTTT